MNTRSGEKSEAPDAFLTNERGLFWWADQEIPANQFAPDSCVSGELQIAESGRATLALDGILTPYAATNPALLLTDDPTLRGKWIRGKLRETNKHVLLSIIARRGVRFASANLSAEGFEASHVLTSDQPFPQFESMPSFSSLELDLRGFEDWLRLGSIFSKRGDRDLHIDYCYPETLEYGQGNSRISIVFDLSGPWSGDSRRHHLELRETASLHFIPGNPFSIGTAVECYGLLQDLFVLLTYSAHDLSWPTLVTPDGHRSIIYFNKISGTDPPPQEHECPTNLIRLKETFGALFFGWLAKRERFGSAFHLYLGTRRGIPLYTEHRFMMLVWGLEAYHRRKYLTPQPGKTKERIERIIDQLSDAKDQKWLKQQLRFAAEPTLAHRISVMLEELPLVLDRKRIRRFAESCAKARNDISHFGGQREGGRTYSEFTLDLHKKSEALTYLYHILALSEIGVDKETLRFWVNESFHSNWIKSKLMEVDLIEHARPSEIHRVRL